jgi:hypothetical protein
MTPEGQVQKSIMDWLKAHGIYHYRQNTGRRGNVNYGVVGGSDIIGCLPDGRFLAIEVKAKGKKDTATLVQLEFLANIAKNGGVAFVAESVADVEKHLTP